MVNFDPTFYGNYYLDLKLKNWNDQQLRSHYDLDGKKGGRMSIEKDFYERYPEFDLEFYQKFHPDFSVFQDDKYSFMRHYEWEGKNEKRLCSEKQFYTKYPEFDLEFYQNYHNDLNYLNGDKYQLMCHYHLVGKKEGRKAYQEFAEIFDASFYGNYYADLKLMHWNEEELKKHFKLDGRKGGRMGIEKDFYERYPEFDLEFYQKFHPDFSIFQGDRYSFMRHYVHTGINEKRWCNEKQFYNAYPDFDLDFYKKYNNDLDYLHGDKYKLMSHYHLVGKNEGRKAYKEFADFFYLNVNIDYFNNSNILLLNDDKSMNSINTKDIDSSKICIIYYYKEIKNEQKSQNNLSFFINYGLDKSRWKQMTISTLIIIDGNCEVLIPERKDIDVVKKENCTTIFDAIHFYEEKTNLSIKDQFTHLFILNSNVIGPIYEDNITNHWLEPFLFVGKNIEKDDVFVGSKNAILFELNNNTTNRKKYITNKIASIFTNYNYQKNIDFLNKKLNYKMNLPTILQSHKLIQYNNKSCVIYSHYDNNNTIKDYVLQNIIMLMMVGYDILFYTSSLEITNYDANKLPFKIHYYPNQPFGGGTDWYMWVDGCKNLQNQDKKYEWIMLMNDSTVLGIHGIENMKKSINTMRESGVDFWGHWDSNEIEYHYHSSLFEFKSYLVPLFVEFAEKNLSISKTKHEIVVNCETKLITFLQSNGYKTDALIKQKDNKFQPPFEFVYNKNNMINVPSHNPLNISNWINNTKAFALKWKYILPYLDSKYVSNECREVFRYIHIGKYIGYEWHFPHIPIDLYRDNNMFLNPYLFLELGTLKQRYIRLNDLIQFY
jgi:hypothetical protein